MARKVQVWAKVDVELRALLEGLALRRGLSLSDVVRVALERFAAGDASRWAEEERDATLALVGVPDEERGSAALDRPAAAWQREGLWLATRRPEVRQAIYAFAECFEKRLDDEARKQSSRDREET